VKRVALYARFSHPTAQALKQGLEVVFPGVRVCGSNPHMVNGVSDRDGSVSLVVVHDHHHGKTGLLRGIYDPLLFVSVRETGTLGVVEIAVAQPESEIPTSYVQATVAQVASGEALQEAIHGPPVEDVYAPVEDVYAPVEEGPTPEGVDNSVEDVETPEPPPAEIPEAPEALPDPPAPHPKYKKR